MSIAPPERQAPGVGLIGLGLMGTAMAERFLAGGFEVVGFDVDPSRLAGLREIGGRPTTDAASVATACARVVLSLPDSPQVTAVLDQIRPFLHPGQIVVDTTTGDPGVAIEAGSILESIGVSYMDATFLGSSAQVRTADAVVMAGGSTVAFEECRDLFALVARRADLVGPVGSGLRMKLVSNLVLGLNRAALAEALSFADGLGLDLTRVIALLRDSAAYSRVMDLKGEKMLTGDFSPQARLSQHHKDVGLILKIGEGAGISLPLSLTHERLLAHAESEGLGGLDNSAIYLAYRSLETKNEIRTNAAERRDPPQEPRGRRD